MANKKSFNPATVKNSTVQISGEKTPDNVQVSGGKTTDSLKVGDKVRLVTAPENPNTISETPKVHPVNDPVDVSSQESFSGEPDDNIVETQEDAVDEQGGLPDFQKRYSVHT